MGISTGGGDVVLVRSPWGASGVVVGVGENAGMAVEAIVMNVAKVIMERMGRIDGD